MTEPATIFAPKGRFVGSRGRKPPEYGPRSVLRPEGAAVISVVGNPNATIAPSGLKEDGMPSLTGGFRPRLLTNRPSGAKKLARYAGPVSLPS
ncbi:MAG: hypothetical protein WCK05_06270 [Planctomycetota bacterium]